LAVPLFFRTFSSNNFKLKDGRLLIVLALACGLLWLHNHSLSIAQSSDSLKTSEGGASFYGNEFHGRRTASGDIFDNRDFTAAHKSLPFNTCVNVVNLKNGKNVIVRINDRGPYIRNRIIDLSRSAAIRIGSHLAGVVPVSIRVLKFIKYTPELDTIYSSSRLVRLNGMPEIELVPGSKSTVDSLDLTYISYFATPDLVHALYFAADLYLKSPGTEFLIGHDLVAGRKRFHVVGRGTGRAEGDKRLLIQLREEGFLECRVF
jgi:hypothetical protein